MSHAIAIRDVHKTYPGGKHALKNFSLEVETGEIFGFLGPNGAGKTTTIKILLGLIKPTSGTVEVLGQDPTKPAARLRLGYLPEVANYYAFMTPRELLTFYGTVCGMPAKLRRERRELLLEQVGIADVADKQLKQFSKGMLQRVGIAQALLHDPDLLILDEPMTGLDPLARLQMRDMILALKQQGKTIFFSSHELSEAEVICDRVGVLKDGELCQCCPTRDMVGDGEANLERIFLRIIAAADPVTAAEGRA